MCVEQIGRVVALPQSEDGVAVVEIDGVLRRVSLAVLVLEGVEVSPGDWLQSHTGLAIRVLAEEEARSATAALAAARRAAAGPSE